MDGVYIIRLTHFRDSDLPQKPAQKSSRSANVYFVVVLFCRAAALVEVAVKYAYAMRLMRCGLCDSYHLDILKPSHL